MWPKLSLIAAAIAIATPALAQQSPPQDYTIKVTTDDVNKIGSALGKLPYDDVVQLIQKLRQQIVEQQAPPKTDAATPIPAPTPGK